MTLKTHKIKGSQPFVTAFAYQNPRSTRSPVPCLRFLVFAVAGCFSGLELAAFCLSGLRFSSVAVLLGQGADLIVLMLPGLTAITSPVALILTLYLPLFSRYTTTVPWLPLRSCRAFSHWNSTIDPRRHKKSE